LAQHHKELPQSHWTLCCVAQLLVSLSKQQGGYLDSSFLGIPAGSGLTGCTAVAGGGGAVLGPPLTGGGGVVLGCYLTGLYVITCLHAPCLCQYIACALHTQYDCCWLPLSAIVIVVASVIVTTSTTLSNVFTGGFLLLLILAMCLMAQGQFHHDIWTATHAQ